MNGGEGGGGGEGKKSMAERCRYGADPISLTMSPLVGAHAVVNRGTDYFD